MYIYENTFAHLHLIEFPNTLQCKAESILNPSKTERCPQTQAAESPCSLSQ